MFEQLVIIGEGESGDVYCADTTFFDKSLTANVKIEKVAVKLVRLSDSTEDASALRLEHMPHEITLWRSCAHAHILPVYECFYEPDVGIWITQELMDRSLADILAVRPSGVEMSERHISRVITDVLSGLEFLHSKRIMHRDCRSDNVMIGSDGVAKLSDFTHACKLEDKRRSVVGTPFWMAPEVIKAAPYDYKADIWSLGVVLYEMVEGDPPRIELPPLSAITLTATVGLPPLRNPDACSPELRQFLAWCTEMEPDNRPFSEMLVNVSLCFFFLLKSLITDSVSPAERILIGPLRAFGHRHSSRASPRCRSRYSRRRVHEFGRRDGHGTALCAA